MASPMENIEGSLENQERLCCLKQHESVLKAVRNHNSWCFDPVSLSSTIGPGSLNIAIFSSVDAAISTESEVVRCGCLHSIVDSYQRLGKGVRYCCIG